MHIYKITNKINGKIYIGLTKNTIEERLKQHKNAALKPENTSPLYNAMRKYGRENFEISLLKTYPAGIDLGARETWWKRKLHSLDDKIGYNICEFEKHNIPNFATRVKSVISRQKNKTLNKNTSSSKYLGVSYLQDIKSWAFHISFEPKCICVKRFASQKDAAIARDYKLLEMLGYNDTTNSMLNFPENIHKYIAKSIPYPQRILKIAHKKSKYIGVQFDKTVKCWYVCIISNINKRIKKGMFNKESEAAEWADRISIENFGPKTKLNFPNKLSDYLDPNYKMPSTAGVQNRKSEFAYVYYNKKTGVIYVDRTIGEKRHRKYGFLTEEKANEYLLQNKLN